MLRSGAGAGAAAHLGSSAVVALDILVTQMLARNIEFSRARNLIHASLLGDDEVVQRSLLRRLSLGARAVVVASPDDGLACLLGREGVFCKKQDIETGRIAPLYMPFGLVVDHQVG